ncbi:MAG: hypothetical protein ABI596_14695 [Pyrinomonadaceae bacterium]
MTTTQRWQEIDRVFAAALDCEPARRAAFLDEACAGDELLRKEVDSLLANDLPGSLVGDAAVQEATRLLIALVVLVASAVGLGVYLSAPNAEAIDSIAVLPFQNKTTETDTEYLSEGLAESLVYRLSKLPNLNVTLG